VIVENHTEVKRGVYSIDVIRQGFMPFHEDVLVHEPLLVNVKLKDAVQSVSCDSGAVVINSVIGATHAGNCVFVKSKDSGRYSTLDSLEMSAVLENRTLMNLVAVTYRLEAFDDNHMKRENEEVITRLNSLESEFQGSHMFSTISMRHSIADIISHRGESVRPGKQGRFDLSESAGFGYARFVVSIIKFHLLDTKGTQPISGKSSDFTYNVIRKNISDNRNKKCSVE